MGKERQELMERVKAQGKAFKAMLASDDAIDAAIDSSASLNSPARNSVKKQDEPLNQEQSTPKTAQASAVTKQAAVVTPPPPPAPPARARAVKKAAKKSASTAPSAPYSNQFIRAVAKQAKKRPRHKGKVGEVSANKAAVTSGSTAAR